ncbi:MAG: hypothetical protein JWP29_5684 [Rhodoferax sp.]|nr:hypothetical protein [Rhodoferax sp.]
MSALDDIAIERQRQIAVEGFPPAHDDEEHAGGELAIAASAYALKAAGVHDLVKTITGLRGWFWLPHRWPLHDIMWKPRSPRRDLVRAGALIVAEIERLDRAAMRRNAA